ncbi:MAG: hypothetical protein KDD94_03450 [Calditrichaeota bacterium]|nr:hypothetical protein [Calditrichota bacterium]
MPFFYVNKNKDEKGYNEVHDQDSANDHRKPEPYNRVNLGFHYDCESAIRTANSMGFNADGCGHCPATKRCHNG